ncbi:FG-GAP repeat protein [candidate division TA06 bacterium]|uniref:FG-GAP repeat protein n=1 Tax=candidate division TA06 bacterium TaxID=2250710 RepID=A0A933MK55_UNCT6|nr:FG-GAP repeat protein [candidate division TA06 bacterium]
MKRCIFILCILPFAFCFCTAQTVYNLEIIFQRGTPDTSLRYWGAAIAGVGDVNGDGYDDVAVGCIRDLGGPGEDTAKVYIFYGSNSFDTIPDLLISDWSSGPGVGICGGDINGDGVSDICITAAGRVYIHFGGNPPSINPDIRFGGRLYENYSVIATGDLNGDDTTDLIVGDFWNMDGNGHVNIYKGSAAFDTIPWLRINGHDYEKFGMGLASGKDVNGDGFDDLAVGANGYNPDERGRVYIFYGGAAMDTIPDWWKDGEGPVNLLGSEGTICFAQDSAGYDKLWFGCELYPGGYNSNNNSGKVWLFNGGNPMDTLPDMTIIGPDTFYGLGTSVASGLVNSGNMGDYIAGAWTDSVMGAIGKSHLWLGSDTPDTALDAWLKGRWFRDCLGVGPTATADVNGDGKDEIILSNLAADTNNIVVICKYTGPDAVAGEPANNEQLAINNLLQNSPNPFKQSTVIKYQLSSPGRVSLMVYNVAGQLVKTLISGQVGAGQHTVKWDGRDNIGNKVSSGIYIYRLSAKGGSASGVEAGNKDMTKKLVVLR